MTSLPRPLAGGLVLVAFTLPATAQTDSIVDLEPARDGRSWTLGDADGSPPYRSQDEIRGARLIDAGVGTRLLVWEELEPGGPVPHYRIEHPARGWSRARRTLYLLRLRHGDFDPLVAEPELADSMLSSGGELHLVQFLTPPVPAFRGPIEALGGTFHQFVADHAHVVRMDPLAAEAVRDLPFVRWVGEYHPEYRLEPELLAGLEDGTLPSVAPYHVQVLEKGPAQKAIVARRIARAGGVVDAAIPDGYLIRAALSPAQLAEVVTWNEVLWVDRWFPAETDMNLVRIDGGADYVESVAGFTGTGVRGEVMDTGVLTTHPDFQSNPILLHTAIIGSISHGTSVIGIVFGDGITNAAARGLLPDGQPIFADFDLMVNRYQHTGELLLAPYFACFQTNSWGNGATTQYNSFSMEVDDILFDQDLVIFQSQSNTGSQNSRPQAWAKNIISVGGIRHGNTLTETDDSWTSGASIGPAADGRVKPDLHYWYDSITTTSSSGGHQEFCCTSAATPTVAGHFGLFYEMWHNGVFGNATGATVFDSRPKATTVRAMMINSAHQYQFSGATSDLTRTHQGWGRPHVQDLYDIRDKMFIVDEGVPLLPQQSIAYPLSVDVGTPALKVTMIYLDPAGTTSSSQHRLNDLSVRVTDPNNVTYWGNNGLDAGNWSTSGGISNTLDPVENVFVQNPTAGTWFVEVIADEVNQDSHVETPAVDADFALVASGVSNSGSPCLASVPYCPGAPNSVGTGAVLATNGLSSVAQNNLVLEATEVPAFESGVFFYGPQTANVPLGDGTRCVGGQLFRLLPPVQSDLFGVAFAPLDIANPPQPLGQISVGETWFFQFWYRDAGGITGSNVSNALEILFCD